MASIIATSGPPAVTPKPLTTGSAGGGGVVGSGTSSGNTLVIPPLSSGGIPSSNSLGSLSGNTLVIPSTIIYPPELAESGLRIAFTFYDYERNSPFVSSNFKYDEGFPIIFLPLPDQLSIAFAIAYDEFNPGYLKPIANDLIQGGFDLNAALLAGGFIEGVSAFRGKGLSGIPAALGAAAVGGLHSGIDTILTKLYNTIKNDPTQARNFFGLASGIPEVAGIVSNYLGIAFNPNTTLMLKAPRLRSHQFTWTFAAKSRDDSDTIDNIISYFEQAFNPSLDPNSGGVFMNYPKLIWPEFINDNGYLYKFKRCLIEGFQVNYSGGGRPSHFSSTHAPTVVQIAIAMREIELFLAGDAIAEAQSDAPITKAGEISGSNPASPELQEMNVLNVPDPLLTTLGIE